MLIATNSANAILLQDGASIAFAFDFTSQANMTAVARGLTIEQHYTGDILTGSDRILLEVMANLTGPTLQSTIVTGNTFGDTSAWAFSMPGSLSGMTPIYSSYTGAFRITALTGSVDLTNVSTTIRDGFAYEWTTVNLDVSPVPEPASWGLMLCGIGSILAVVKRKKNRA